MAPPRSQPPRPVPPKRRGPAESVGTLLPQLLDEVGLDGTAQAVQIIRAWNDVLGADFAAHCRPAGVRNGVAHAHVRDSGWMQRLQLEKPRILERLKNELGDAAPTDLRLRIGPV